MSRDKWCMFIRQIKLLLKCFLLSKPASSCENCITGFTTLTGFIRMEKHFRRFRSERKIISTLTEVMKRKLQHVLRFKDFYLTDGPEADLDMEMDRILGRFGRCESRLMLRLGLALQFRPSLFYASV